jgi:hypothetical protein
VNGHKYTQDLDKEESPDKGEEDAEETEFDREEDSVPVTSSKPETTPQKSEQLAEGKKKPVEKRRKTAEEKGKLVEDKKYPHLEKFQPRLGGPHLSDNYTASGVAKQNVWWANKIAATINKLTAQN